MSNKKLTDVQERVMIILAAGGQAWEEASYTSFVDYTGANVRTPRATLATFRAMVAKGALVEDRSQGFRRWLLPLQEPGVPKAPLLRRSASYPEACPYCMAPPDEHQSANPFKRKYLCGTETYLPNTARQEEPWAWHQSAPCVRIEQLQDMVDGAIDAGLALLGCPEDAVQPPGMLCPGANGFVPECKDCWRETLHHRALLHVAVKHEKLAAQATKEKADE